MTCLQNPPNTTPDPPSPLKRLSALMNILNDGPQPHTSRTQALQRKTRHMNTVFKVYLFFIRSLSPRTTVGSIFFKKATGARWSWLEKRSVAYRLQPFPVLWSMKSLGRERRDGGGHFSERTELRVTFEKAFSPTLLQLPTHRECVTPKS